MLMLGDQSVGKWEKYVDTYFLASFLKASTATLTLKLVYLTIKLD